MKVGANSSMLLRLSTKDLVGGNNVMVIVARLSDVKITSGSGCEWLAKANAALGPSETEDLAPLPTYALHLAADGQITVNTTQHKKLN